MYLKLTLTHEITSRQIVASRLKTLYTLLKAFFMANQQLINYIIYLIYELLAGLLRTCLHQISKFWVEIENLRN